MVLDGLGEVKTECRSLRIGCVQIRRQERSSSVEKNEELKVREKTASHCH
jgi:hypothetical protein